MKASLPAPTGPEERRRHARRRLARLRATALYRWARAPLVAFIETEASGGLVLMATMVAALVWANSPWAGSYHDFWHAHFHVALGGLELDLSVAHWINDGFMAVFFFLVGLEIKRELISGELASARRAALPIMAAVGGMVVPALLYFAWNSTGPESRGWGVPMATDIAFALGVLALLGDRVPLGLKVFLTALAIVDDLGAVLVIAVFYTDALSFPHLASGLALIAGLFLLNRFGVRRVGVYISVGVVVWYLFLESGVHATIAGVLVAATIPHHVIYDRARFTRRIRTALDVLDHQPDPGTDEDEVQREVAMEIVHEATERWGSPLHRLEHHLAPWVSYGIMPVFALANAGVPIDPGGFLGLFRESVPLGIVLGLFVGKQIGVFAFSWVAVRLNLAALPEGATWRSLYGVGVLAGIGFTMSLFVANLAFDDPQLLEAAKVGVLTASLLAGVVGSAVVALTGPRKRRAGRPDAPESTFP